MSKKLYIVEYIGYHGTIRYRTAWAHSQADAVDMVSESVCSDQSIPLHLRAFQLVAAYVTLGSPE